MLTQADMLSAAKKYSEIVSNAKSFDPKKSEQAIGFAKLQFDSASLNLNETQIVSFESLVNDWKPDVAYAQGTPVCYQDKIYRVSQAHTSQEVYPPDTAGESLYYEIQIAPDGVIVYRECHGQYDSVQKGELRHYPDAEGPVYESLLESNAYSPDDYPQGWKLVEEV